MAEDPITPEVATERESESFSEALPLYLQEIGRVPLLTGAAEVELAMAIEAGTEAAALLQDGVHRSADENPERRWMANHWERFHRVYDDEVMEIWKLAPRDAAPGQPEGRSR